MEALCPQNTIAAVPNKLRQSLWVENLGFKATFVKQVHYLYLDRLFKDGLGRS